MATGNFKNEWKRVMGSWWKNSLSRKKKGGGGGGAAELQPPIVSNKETTFPKSKSKMKYLGVLLSVERANQTLDLGVWYFRLENITSSSLSLWKLASNFLPVEAQKPKVTQIWCATCCTIHVIRVFLPSQSASKKHNQQKEPIYLCAPCEFPTKFLNDW